MIQISDMKNRFSIFIISIFLITFSAGFLFGQEASDEIETVIYSEESDSAVAVDESVEADGEVDVLSEAKSKKGFFDIFAFCLGFTPSLIVNIQGNTTSAPSPIVFPVYVGVAFPQDLFISVQPSLKVYNSYYLVTEDGVVAPAEIENRTVSALSFLIDIPVLFRIDFFGKVDVRASAGISALIRYGFLASGVKDGDYGYTGSAAGDMAYINEWFYSNLRFLYLSGGVSVLFRYNGLKFGPELSVYFPMALITDNTMDSTIISAGLKLVF